MKNENNLNIPSAQVLHEQINSMITSHVDKIVAEELPRACADINCYFKTLYREIEQFKDITGFLTRDKVYLRFDKYRGPYETEINNQLRDLIKEKIIELGYVIIDCYFSADHCFYVVNF